MHGKWVRSVCQQGAALTGRQALLVVSDSLDRLSRFIESLCLAAPSFFWGPGQFGGPFKPPLIPLCVFKSTLRKKESLKTTTTTTTCNLIPRISWLPSCAQMISIMWRHAGAAPLLTTEDKVRVMEMPSFRAGGVGRLEQNKQTNRTTSGMEKKRRGAREIGNCQTIVRIGGE